jgi:LAO/AO transport system kinase
MPHESHETLRLFERAKGGEQRSIARLCSIFEHRPSDALLAHLDVAGMRWTANVVSITGAPGSGKSTLVARLIAHYRRAGDRVAVLAIDPTSSITGGAILGDRVRLDPADLDEGVFFRSVADHGHGGGVSAATAADIALFDACGFDVIVVETVGAGQSDVDVRGFVDTVIVAVPPGAGDEIQTLKAGILEIGDIFVASKSDLEGSAKVAGDLREMVALGTTPADGWRPPVLSVSAADEASIEALRDELERRHEWLQKHQPRTELASARACAQVIDATVDLVRQRLTTTEGAAIARGLGTRVAMGEADLQEAAAETLRAVVEKIDEP